LLEHPPTLTLGKSGKLENLLVPREELAARGISLFFTDRGRDITYHGPDQLVVYPIIDLKRRGKDVHRYIYDLQEVLMRTPADFSIQARRSE
jgi:lipoate-protein ligase B